MKSASAYARFIEQDLRALGVPGVDPRHVEAWLRERFGTLDHLDAATFRREVRAAVVLIYDGGPALSESLAQSYGL